MRHDRNSARLAEDDTSDPIAVDWGSVELPDAWPDTLDLRRPSEFVAYWRGWFGARRKVELPGDMPGSERVPLYLRQEFHHLPNGFYSKRHADGYARWFDRLMLGHTVETRTRIARELAGCGAVLDAGTGVGSLAGAMVAAGIPDVWAIEPSPYLLQIAAQRHPRVRFVHGVVEQSGFADERFDGVGACFLFHELPARVADAALAELRRILVPGGKLLIAEPSPVQFHVRDWRGLLRREGRRGLYFFLVANWMHEPFVRAWHRRDVAPWLAAHGFELVDDEHGMPIRYLSARRVR
jgi:ubiquinone/menaquinone biosynthesis C-methylase UbiE